MKRLVEEYYFTRIKINDMHVFWLTDVFISFDLFHEHTHTFSMTIHSLACCLLFVTIASNSGCLVSTGNINKMTCNTNTSCSDSMLIQYSVIRVS